MIPIGFFAVGGALGPAHCQVGDAESGNVGEVMDGVVEERDAAAENAAENLRDDQAECEDHGPAKDGRLQGAVRMPGLAMSMTGVAMAMIVAVSMPGHAAVLRAQIVRPRPRQRLWGHLTATRAEGA